MRTSFAIREIAGWASGCPHEWRHEKMIADDRFYISRNQIYTWGNEYLKSIDMQENIHDLAAHFIRSKIFALADDSIQFRHDMFLAYFVAQRMISSKDCF